MRTSILAVSFATNRWRPQLVVALVMSAGVWAAPQAAAQTPSSIDGTLTDASGGVLANAKVSVTNAATNVIKTTVASTAGTYIVTGLIAGSYTVKVENKGFQTLVHKEVTVEVGRSATIDAVLETGKMTEMVEVHGDLDPFHLRELTAAPTCTEPPPRIR
ncbi:MAG: carboxypeptidase-like regulatory domain-containing protein [Bryobacteraceae bacterium]